MALEAPKLAEYPVAASITLFASALKCSSVIPVQFLNASRSPLLPTVVKAGKLMLPVIPVHPEKASRNPAVSTVVKAGKLTLVIPVQLLNAYLSPEAPTVVKAGKLMLPVIPVQ